MPVGMREAREALDKFLRALSFDPQDTMEVNVIPGLITIKARNVPGYSSVTYDIPMARGKLDG